MKPLHPILVHFPIALLPVSVAADAVGFFGHIASLGHAAAWTLFAAAGAGVATVIAGFYDMHRAPLSEDTHVRVHRHMRVGLALATGLIGLATWRGAVFLHDGVISIYYLDLAVLGVALAAFQGWLGGELVYTDGVFVRAGEAGPGEVLAHEDSGHEASRHDGHSHHH